MFTGLGKLDDLLGDNFVGEIATLFKSERDAGQFIYDANDAFGISIEPLDAKVSLDQGEIETPPVRTAGLQLFPTGGPRNVRPNNSVSCAGFRRSIGPPGPERLHGVFSVLVSSISPEAILPTMTAAPITSAGRFSP